MKTFTITNPIRKAVALTALILTPALALTSSAQAAPSYRAPVVQRSNNASTWNNNSRAQAPRFDNRYTPAPRVQAPRYVPQYNQGNYNQPRYDVSRNNGRFDSRRNNNGNDTTKIIGAGIVGAILGAVISR